MSNKKDKANAKAKKEEASKATSDTKENAIENETQEATSHDNGNTTPNKLSMVDEFNAAFSRHCKAKHRHIDILRIRKVMIPEKCTELKKFIFEIGMNCNAEKRNVYLFEAGCFLILWETIEE